MNANLLPKHRLHRLLAALLLLPFQLNVAEFAYAESDTISLDANLKQRCLTVLRTGLQSDDFWPAMHAAEGLTQAGHGAEVIDFLKPQLKTTTDAQQRCGVARELVRAGQKQYVAVLLSVLEQDDDYGHGHACESLYKVYELGDGQSIRAIFEAREPSSKTTMAAAALARWGNPEAFAFLRAGLNGEDVEQARLSAWVLGRIGDPQDLPALKKWRKQIRETTQRHYFDNAAAMLGDPEARQIVLENLTHDDSAVRTYAAVFAGEMRLTAARESLMKLLDDPHADAAIRAAHALLMLSQPKSTNVDSQSVVADVYPATAEHPRYSEGSIIALDDGSLLFATTEFEKSSDFASAQIVARSSTDGGQTWGAQRVLQPNVGGQNVMSATLRRLGEPTDIDQPIGLFYLVKNSYQDLKVYLRISHDETKSFGEPIMVTNTDGYHVCNNDRATRLSSGRWLVPVASTADVHTENHFVCRCFLSDDDGKTWREGSGTVDYAKRGAMEPEVIELTDGRVLMIFRTQLGHIARSYSTDGGETWSEPESFGVKAPEAPATLRRIPSTGDLLLVWNHHFEQGAGHGGKRTPLTIAISRDEGESWQYEQQLETDPDLGYAYCSLVFERGRVLLSYYIHDAVTKRISSRFRALPISQLYASTKNTEQSTEVEPEVVLTLAPEGNNLRNSEGDFVRLKDGRLLFVYSHFTNGAGDHSSADLNVRTSADGGKTWSEDETTVVENAAGMNVMSVSLLRLTDGRIGLFYLQKESLKDCRPCLRISTDEGKTWGPQQVCITDEVGYYVMNNDRVVQLSSGRILLPVCLHEQLGDNKLDWNGECMCYLSDDGGKSWRRSESQVKGFAENGRRLITQEPGVVELSDGRVMMFARSNAGSQLVSYSSDGGETWSAFKPSSMISPVSPATIEPIPGTDHLLLIWNDHTNATAEIRGKRTPLTAAISRDDGVTWSDAKNIWDDPHRHYCYMAVEFVDDAVLIGHCAGDRRVNNGLAESHLTRVPLEWLYAAEDE